MNTKNINERITLYIKGTTHNIEIIYSQIRLTSIQSSILRNKALEGAGTSIVFDDDNGVASDDVRV